MDITEPLRALANERRCIVLEWLKDPRSHFREQVHGDLVEDGVCGGFIAEKLGVSQPTLSVHMRALVQAGFVTSKRIKQFTFFKRDEARIAEIMRVITTQISGQIPGQNSG